MEDRNQSYDRYVTYPIPPTARKGDELDFIAMCTWMVKTSTAHMHNLQVVQRKQDAMQDSVTALKWGFAITMAVSLALGAGLLALARQLL